MPRKRQLTPYALFYSYIVRHKPLGIAYPKEALRPLLSKRLAQELDSLRACDDDYYQRYGEILRANHYKPATPWLEEGLFSGPDEAAGPMKFSILSSKIIGEDRVDVHLRFTLRDYCCDHPVLHFHTEGVVTAILENHRWVIDDFVAMYSNDELDRLSNGYPECKDGKWVGETPY